MDAGGHADLDISAALAQPGQGVMKGWGDAERIDRYMRTAAGGIANGGPDVADRRRVNPNLGAQIDRQVEGIGLTSTATTRAPIAAPIATAERPTPPQP